MTFNEYQKKANKTKIYKEQDEIIYPTLGLCSEAGEVSGKVKKVLRDYGSFFSPAYKKDILSEVGDCLWYISALATDLGYTLEEVAKMNIDKLKDRKKRNKIKGEGDNR